MKKPIKMVDIIRRLPAGRWFYYSSITGLRMAPGVFSARIKKYRDDGTIKSKLIDKHKQYFISKESRMKLLEMLSKPDERKLALSSELFNLAMRA